MVYYLSLFSCGGMRVAHVHRNSLLLHVYTVQLIDDFYREQKSIMHCTEYFDETIEPIQLPQSSRQPQTAKGHAKEHAACTQAKYTKVRSTHLTN